MDIRILSLVSNILPPMSGADAKYLEYLVRLVQAVGDAQSDPSSAVPDLLERLENSGELKEFLLQVSEKIRSGQPLTEHNWLLLSYLATFKMALKDLSDIYYKAIFEAYPLLRSRIGHVLEVIEDFPFAAAVDRLERDWANTDTRPEFDMVSLTYVRACGLIGIFGSNLLYQRVSAYLTFKKAFLVVVLAGACFKVEPIASRVNIGNWTDTQYACMNVLDNFVHLGDTAWG